MPTLFVSPSRYRGFVAVLGVALMTTLAACTTDSAGTGAAGVSPLAGAARAIGVATTEPDPQEFVRSSRPATTPDYIPVGVTPPARAEPKRNAEALLKLEQELDGQRTKARSYAARPKPPSSYDGKIPPRPAPLPKELTPE
jgi:hypothetical protein